MGDLRPVRFGSRPSPLEPAPRLAAELGLAPDALWLKRDDLGGLGGGGNKVRKLEYTCADALAAGATTLLTTGAAQSNHARLTAAAAARLGLGAVLVLEGAAPERPRGNLVLDELAGATVVWSDEPAAEVHRRAAAVRAEGGVPYVVPFGGSSPLSARGYADCAAELLEQLPDLDRVVVALGSGGTMAGLVLGLGAERVLGVDTGAVADPHAAVTALLGDPPADLRIDRDQVGDGYAALTPGAAAALRLAARTEGVFLDPVYTARAMAGLVAAAAAGTVRPGERTVFLHSGGLPGLFGHPALA